MKLFGENKINERNEAKQARDQLYSWVEKSDEPELTKDQQDHLIIKLCHKKGITEYDPEMKLELY